MGSYVVSQARLEFFRKKGVDVCSKCGKRFHVGDVITARNANRKHWKIYHAECWNAMFFEPT